VKVNVLDTEREWVIKNCKTNVASKEGI